MRHYNQNMNTYTCSFLNTMPKHATMNPTYTYANTDVIYMHIWQKLILKFHSKKLMA